MKNYDLLSLAIGEKQEEDVTLSRQVSASQERAPESRPVSQVAPSSKGVRLAFLPRQL